MGKFLDLAEHLLPYLEAEGGDFYVLGLSGGLNKIISYRACDGPWSWQ